MPAPDREALEQVLAGLTGRRWTAADLDALVAAGDGVITGFADLLEDLEKLRRIDLGRLPPGGTTLPPVGDAR